MSGDSPNPSGGTGSTTNPLFQNSELEQFARFLTASLSTALSSSQTAPKKRVQHLKPSDLPTFKGDSLDGGDAEAFLTKLETTFKLANTADEEKVEYASQAFPERSTAQSWFEEQRAEGTFDHPLHEDRLDFESFVKAFTERFATPLARRYQLEDLWDKFTQKGSVKEHYTKFTRLLVQLKHLGITHQSDVVASKYLRSLKPEIFQLLAVKNTDGAVPEFQAVHGMAIEAEYQLGRSGRTPQLNGLLPPFSPSPSDSSAKPKVKEHKFWCHWHKGNNSHATKDCKKIASLKAAGKWFPDKKATEQ